MPKAKMNDYKAIGTAVRDAEVKFLSTGVAICEFSIAVDTGYWSKKEEKWVDRAAFLDVSIFNNAEKVGEAVVKGAPVLIFGELDQQTWDDKQSGQKRSKIGIKAFKVQVLDRAPRQDSGGSQERAPQQQRPQQSAPPSDPATASFYDDGPQDTPF